MRYYHYILCLVVFPVSNIFCYGALCASFTNSEFIRGAFICYLFWAAFAFILAVSNNLKLEKFHPYINVDISKPPLKPVLPKMFKKNGDETWMSKKMSNEYRAYMARYNEKLNLYKKEVQVKIDGNTGI